MSKSRLRGVIYVAYCVLLLASALEVGHAQNSAATQSVTFEGLELKLPTRFQALPVPAGRLPDFMKLQPFQATKGAEVVEAVMLIRNSHPQLSKELEKDFNKSVNNFVAGLVRQQQLTLGKPTVDEPFEWKGHAVTKYTYKAKLPSGADSLVVAFAFTDKDAFVCMTHVNYTTDDAKLSTELQETLFEKEPAKTKAK